MIEKPWQHMFRVSSLPGNWTSRLTLGNLGQCFRVSTSLLRVHLRGVVVEMRQVTAFLLVCVLPLVPRTHLRRQKSADHGGETSIAILLYIL